MVTTGSPFCGYTQGDSDVISMLAGFRRHLVGKTLKKCFSLQCRLIPFVGKLVELKGGDLPCYLNETESVLKNVHMIIQTFS